MNWCKNVGVLIIILANVLCADVVTLRDGRTFEGTIVGENERFIVIRTATGDMSILTELVAIIHKDLPSTADTGAPTPPATVVPRKQAQAPAAEPASPTVQSSQTVQPPPARPPGSRVNAEGEANTERKEKNKLHVFQAWFDPAGFIFFGPTVAGEVVVAPGTYLVVSYRELKWGLLYKAVIGDVDLKQTSGLGFGLRYYHNFRRMPHNLIAGGAVEIDLMEYHDTEYTWYYNESLGYSTTGDREYVSDCRMLTVMGNIGWRWRIGETHAFHILIALQMGMSIETSYESTWIDDGTIRVSDSDPGYDPDVYPAGMLHIGIGFGI